MSILKDTIEKLEHRALNPAETIAASIAETGKDAVGCFPIYTPEEIVYAGGFLPVGMWGGKTEIKLADKYLQGFCCSIMRANLELGMRGTYHSLKAVIIPALCDTLKCMCENWKVAVPDIPMIGLVYPQTRWTKASEEYLIAEFKRIRTDLEKVTGTLIHEEKVKQAFSLYEEYRAAMRDFVEVAREYPITIHAKTRHLMIKAGYFMDKAIYTREIKLITEELKKMPKEDFDGIKVVTTGYIGEPVEILDIFTENNMAVVADDIAQESRQYRTVSRESGDVWERMAGRIIDQRGCTFLCEEKKSRGQMLIDMVKATGAKAVVVCMMKFCDPEEFDYPVYKAQLEEAGIPILYLELDQQIESFEQIRTRIQSFAEMVD
ncbi:2-hydroxyacyl-CoA dehydratase subunit D [Clostridium aminobutyricum]|uniref:2-hydroxyacyl-CoA dehydratase n=1 Tax=Clostridium aminobutyricum TaxID=33953 RepID=A0A939DA54_CLOAM|nr:2-hydroxyacyl-CoA dehydratase family protein [Clostridium aminobutyricum]MBN7773573.1 2-hydroxyacyl-CoA dehydratase [Clostridium aminobutyricum]